jgi:putative ABC transport system permease protein
VNTLLQDVRYTLRLWRRNPGFTLVVVLTLALGIGANTTMFGIVNATLFRALPLPEADRIMTLWRSPANAPRDLNIVSQPNYLDYRTRNHVFSSLAIFDSAGRGYNLTSSGDPEQVSGLRVTASFFDVLGVRPLIGRNFLPEEEQPGRDREVILSHGLWVRRYAADPSIVGRTIQIDGLAYAVVGIMPPDFHFQFWSGERQLWVPVGWTRGDLERGSNSFLAIGRLRDGVSVTQARADMDVIGRALAREYPSENIGTTVRVVPLAEYGLGDIRTPLLTLLAIVGFVLLIACVNVANLMLARSATRQREMAIRAAIGAGRARIFRQVLTESVCLAVAGAAAALVVTAWGTSLLPALLPDGLKYLAMRPLDAVPIDGRVLLFTGGVALLSSLLFRTDPGHALKDQARGSSAHGSRLRYLLVSAEVALTLVVLAGAGAMILSVSRLLHVNPGLDPTNVLVMQMSLPQADLYYGPPDHEGFCRDLADQVGTVPGVLSVSAIAHLPLSGAGAGRGLTIEGHPYANPEEQPGAGYSVACPGIMHTLGIPLEAGREFRQSDGLGAPGVVLINEHMARQYWPGESAIGKRFKIGTISTDAPWLTVVGVYRDVRHWGLDSDIDSQFIRPYMQAGWPFLSIVARTASAPEGYDAALRKALARIEPGQPVSSVSTMSAVIGDSVSSRRFPMLLLSVFAALALVLAAVGIAGVVGYSVAQRTREIGLRMALGAQSADVLRLVIGHSLWWTLAGIAAGVAGAYGVLRSLSALLYAVTPSDPGVLMPVAVVLLAVAAGASYLPARRAARVDPVDALRCD